jgi:hypothetical protein
LGQSILPLSIHTERPNPQENQAVVKKAKPLVPLGGRGRTIHGHNFFKKEEEEVFNYICNPSPSFLCTDFIFYRILPQCSSLSLKSSGSGLELSHLTLFKTISLLKGTMYL